MVFGYSTNAYVKYSVKESLERIAALGFKGAEIMCDRPHLYPPDFDAAALADLKSVLDTHHLHVTNLNSFTLFAVGDTYLPSWIEPEAERRRIRIRAVGPGASAAAAKAMRRAPARALRHHRSPKAPRRWATWDIPAGRATGGRPRRSQRRASGARRSSSAGLCAV